MNELKEEIREIIDLFRQSLAVQDKMINLMIEDKQESKEKEKTAQKKSSNLTMLLATALVMTGLIICTMVWFYFSLAYNDNFSVDMKIDNKSKSEVQENYRR